MNLDFISYGGAFLAFIFAIHLFTYSKGNILLNKLLGLLFMIRALNNAVYLFNTAPLSSQDLWALIITQLLIFFSPSLFYLYLRCFIGDETKLRKSDYLHAIFPIFILTLESILFLLKKNGVTLSWINSELNLFILIVEIKAILFLVYIFFCWKILIYALKDKSNPVNRDAKNWILTLLSIVSIANLMQFLFCFFILFNIINSDPGFDDNKAFVISGFFTSFFIFFIIRSPNVLYGNLTTRLNSIPFPIGITTPKPLLKEIVGPQIKDQSLLEGTQIDNYIEIIYKYMDEMTPYLDPDFSIGIMAEELGIPSHHCSFVLNQGLKKNFREFTNKYRVDFFIKEFIINSEHMTLEAIAKHAGFKSKSTFYAAFNKEKGCSPSKYF